MGKTKKTLTQEIADLLQANTEDHSEGYNGEEMIEAMSLMPPDTILAIPFCAYDFVQDEFGVTVMESEFDRIGARKNLTKDGAIDTEWIAKPERKSRFDVLAILAWIPFKRENPDITLEEATKLLNAGNLQEITQLVFKFWGVDYEKAAEQLDKLEADMEEAKKELEAEETGDFPE